MTDKATPSPASVDRFMSLLRNHENQIAETFRVLQDIKTPSEEVRAAIDASSEARNALIAEVERLAAQSAPSEPTVSLAKSRIGRVYLAGPMTGYENFNFPAFNAAAQRLRAEGFDVVNPADHGIVDGAEWADYLRFDLGKLAQCESIALLPGWEVSKGANLEVSVAQKLGMVVRCLDGAAQPSQAPVVLAVQPEYCTACDMTSNDKQRCEDCPRRASSGATTQAVRMLTKEELTDLIASTVAALTKGQP